MRIGKVVQILDQLGSVRRKSWKEKVVWIKWHTLTGKDIIKQVPIPDDLEPHTIHLIQEADLERGKTIDCMDLENIFADDWERGPIAVHIEPKF